MTPEKVAEIYAATRKLAGAEVSVMRWLIVRDSYLCYVTGSLDLIPSCKPSSSCENNYAKKFDEDINNIEINIMCSWIEWSNDLRKHFHQS